jgi:hypothetical protein
MEIKPTHRRICEACTKEFIVYHRVSAKQAAKKKYCTRECAVSGIWKGYVSRRVPRPKKGVLVETSDGFKMTRPGRRVASIARYINNPKLCRECQNPLPLRNGEVPHDLRERSFCSVPCSEKARKRFWEGKEASDFYDITTLPKRVRICTLPFQTLGDDSHFKKRGDVHKHARKVYFSAFPDQYFCQICEKHSPTLIDVCHLKPVAQFTDEDTLLMISQLDNLIGGDPICHKLLDLGRIPRARIDEILSKRIPRIR